MAVIAHQKALKRGAVYYVIIDLRNEKLNSHYYKGIDVVEGGLPKSATKSRRVVVIRPKILPKSCRPRLKDPESSGISWRRKQSRTKQRRPTPPRPPTLLLPPMRFPEGPPLLAAQVQQPQEAYRGLESTSHQGVTLPKPSAPSPSLFYNSEDHSDVTFIVGPEEWRFPAHTFVLGSTRSTLLALVRSARGPHSDDVLDRLLGTEVRPGQLVPVVLKLPNMQPDVFEQILRYIYTGQVTLLTVDSTLRLLHPSRLYHLPSLTSHCLNHLSKNVNTSNVLLVLSHLLCPESVTGDQSTSDDCHDNDNARNELVFKCFLIVDHHADTVLQSEHFETLEHELMVEIIKRDSLEVTSETVVFEAAMRWACRSCKKQKVELTPDNKVKALDKALFLVRYLTMAPEEFLRGPVSQGVVSKEDKDAFLSRLSDPASQVPLPERWAGWKIAEKRLRCQNLLSVASPHSDVSSSGGVDMAVTPTNSSQTVTTNAKRADRKKKSMSKKLLNGVGDLVICVIQLLD